MRLVVVHYHLRPSGIRRVIEQALPSLVHNTPASMDRVTLATGEAADVQWTEALRKELQPVPLQLLVEPAFGYFAEQTAGVRVIRRQVRAGLARLFDERADDSMVWAHNLGIARNLLLTAELFAHCMARRIPILAHHHDWWFDNRWHRWPAIRLAGYRTLTAVAAITFPSSPTIRHAGINSADTTILRRHMQSRAGWLPNPTGRLRPPDPAVLDATRIWLDRQLDERNATVWVLPCRLLRRKNVAEAVLLTRWLRPNAWLTVTGGVSSADERSYANRLIEAARRGRWRLRLGLLQGAGASCPGIPELLGASEAVLLTSIQEGFGLPYLEAAAAGRPLLSRTLPNVAPDLHRFGFRFPYHYDDIYVDPGLFDWQAEVVRQTRLYRHWRLLLPRSCRSMAGEPWLLMAKCSGQPVPFSRLTLSAQLEVLAHPPDVSWQACVPFNPFLPKWRALAESGRLRNMTWPRDADRWLGGTAYARRFFRLMRKSTARVPSGPTDPDQIQQEFLHGKLSSNQLYPLLWGLDS